MSTLILIPARFGSKGIPGKNIKILGGKPLVVYSIEFALKIKKSADLVCLTTNDPQVIDLAKNYVPNLIIVRRPDSLSTDKIGMTSVINHAIELFEGSGLQFEKILLLQPTSPFRAIEDYEIICSLLSETTDMVVSVKKSKKSPYFSLFEEDESGLLKKCKEGDFECRQDCPDVFEYNGSMYLIKKSSFKLNGLHGMTNIRKMLMPEDRSIDIDDPVDWEIANYFINQKIKGVL